MSAMKRSVLIAFALLSAVVVVASPAFATPNITASSGTRAVAPFITPITSTRSQFTGSARDTRLTIDAVFSTIECTTTIVSGYVDTTHTQARITSLSFGNRSGRDCVVRTGLGSGTVNADEITCTATSANPWLLHMRARNGASTTSWDGTINNTSSCSFAITVGGSTCDFTIPAGQSIAVRYTNTRARLEVSALSSRTSSFLIRVRNFSGCSIPDGIYSATIVSTYIIRVDTARDRAPTVTAAS